MDGLHSSALSKSSSPFSNPLVTVPKAPITIGINCHLHVTQLFQFSRKVEVFILLFIFFQFYSVVSWNSKVDNFANSLFFLLLLIIIRSGILAEIRWSVCMSKSHRSLCVYYYYYYFTPCKFFTPWLAGGLSRESERQQISIGLLLSVLADLSKAVVWMVPILPLISNCSNSPCIPLGTFPKASIGITITSIFHTSFCSLASICLPSHFLKNVHSVPLDKFPFFVN